MRRVSKKKERTWEIRCLKASPAAFIGLVDAPDEAKAKELANNSIFGRQIKSV
jgi:hypothetical protein